MGFFESFLELYRQRNPEKEIKEFHDPSFRKLYLDQYGINVESIKRMAVSLLPGMLKPQRPLEDQDNFYVGQDLYTNTYYICYSSLLMVDIDFYKDGESRSIEEICDRIEKYTKDKPQLKFLLYQTRNGVHAFLISQPSNYKDDVTLQIMLDLDCDFYYTIYSYLRGWSVRVNRKKTDQDPLYTFIGDIGKGPIDDNLVKLVDLHIKLCVVFKDTGSNLMYDG